MLFLRHSSVDIHKTSIFPNYQSILMLRFVSYAQLTVSYRWTFRMLNVGIRFVQIWQCTTKQVNGQEIFSTQTFCTSCFFLLV